MNHLDERQRARAIKAHYDALRSAPHPQPSPIEPQAPEPIPLYWWVIFFVISICAGIGLASIINIISWQLGKLL